MSALRVQNLTFAYPGGTFRLEVKALEAGAGEPLAILGPSGEGKTTLLRLLAGLLRPQTGEVALGGESLPGMVEARLREFRLRSTGLVFQDFALLDYLTVGENILLPLRFGGGDFRQGEERARMLAGKLQMERFWRQPAGSLSQGEKQRVAVARALVHRPAFVFADEPTASLDVRRRDAVMQLLLEDARERQAVLAVVTHDAELVPLFTRHFQVEGARS